MGHLSTKSMLARAVILVALVVVESLWLEGSELARSMLEGAKFMIARSAGLALGLAGFANTVKGNEIQLPDGAVAVTEECVGLDVSLFLASAMFVQSAPVGQKILGAVASVLAVSSLNWVRVVTLALLVQIHPSLFDAVHYYVWPAAIIIVAVAILLLWMRTLPGGAEVDTA